MDEKQNGQFVGLLSGITLTEGGGKTLVTFTVESRAQVADLLTLNSSNWLTLDWKPYVVPKKREAA